MAMRQAGFVWPVFFALGIAAFLLRAAQLRWGFDPDGLAVPAFPPSAALLLLTALTIPAAALCAGTLPPRGAAAALCAPPPRWLQGVCAALWGLMGVTALSVANEYADFLFLILALLALAGCLCMLLIRRAGGRPALLELTVFAAASLAVCFIRHASDPNWMRFWPLLAALCCTVLSALELFSAACAQPRPRRSLFFLLCGGVLCPAALADCCTPARLPFFFGLLGAALVQWHYSRSLLRAR